MGPKFSGGVQQIGVPLLAPLTASNWRIHHLQEINCSDFHDLKLNSLGNSEGRRLERKCLNRNSRGRRPLQSNTKDSYGLEQEYA